MMHVSKKYNHLLSCEAGILGSVWTGYDQLRHSDPITYPPCAKRKRVLRSTLYDCFGSTYLTAISRGECIMWLCSLYLSECLGDREIIMGTVLEILHR